jgi:hypothetical protein
VSFSFYSQTTGVRNQRAERQNGPIWDRPRGVGIGRLTGRNTKQSKSAALENSLIFGDFWSMRFTMMGGQSETGFCVSAHVLMCTTCALYWVYTGGHLRGLLSIFFHARAIRKSCIDLSTSILSPTSSLSQFCKRQVSSRCRVCSPFSSKGHVDGNLLHNLDMVLPQG